MDLNEKAKEVHAWAVEKGFWIHDIVHDPHFETGVGNPSIAAEKIALMHSELSEALEALRDGRWFDEKGCVAEEMADTVIRILDFCGKYDIKLEDEITTKMRFNDTRERRHGRRF